MHTTETSILIANTPKSFMEVLKSACPWSIGIDC